LSIRLSANGDKTSLRSAKRFEKTSNPREISTVFDQKSPFDGIMEGGCTLQYIFTKGSNVGPSTNASLSSGAREARINSKLAGSDARIGLLMIAHKLEWPAPPGESSSQDWRISAPAAPPISSAIPSTTDAVRPHGHLSARGPEQPRQGHERTRHSRIAGTQRKRAARGASGPSLGRKRPRRATERDAIASRTAIGYTATHNKQED